MKHAQRIFMVSAKNNIINSYWFVNSLNNILLIADYDGNHVCALDMVGQNHKVTVVGSFEDLNYYQVVSNRKNKVRLWPFAKIVDTILFTK